MSISETSEIEGVVAFFDNIMILELLAVHKLVIEARESHETFVRVVMQVKAKTFVLQITQLKKGRQMTHGNSVISKTQYSTELRYIKCDAAHLRNLPEPHVSLHFTSDSHLVLADEALDAATAILNGEGLSTFLIALALLRLEGLVVPAYDGRALVRVDPQVAGASVWHHRKGLAGSAQAKLYEILRVHVVLQRDILVAFA